jgi:hypothetical protein
MILTTTSPSDTIKNKIKDSDPINAIKEDKILIKPFRFSQLLALIKAMTTN